MENENEINPPPPQETKKCRTCQETKDINDFYKSKLYPHHSKQHYRSYCKQCQNKERAMLTRKKREAMRAAQELTQELPTTPVEPKPKPKRIRPPKPPKPPKEPKPPKPPKEPKPKYTKKELPPKGERLYRFYSLPKELQDQLVYLLSYRGEGKKLFLTNIHKILNNELLPYKTIHYFSVNNIPKWNPEEKEKPIGLQALLDNAGIELR